ncbi:MAG TPA: GntR family transcriptional regulator [Rhizobiaceae bacterium]|nr:GntR family transcriptional regulator [Rhizobiaceae bacterium]
MNALADRGEAQDGAGVTPFLLDRRMPAADQVYRLLRDAIITCQLEPNEAVSENRLCGMFGVSRSPVRIALTRLAEDGLIDIYPQRGTFVAPIRLAAVREAQFARSALETALVAEAARRWNAADRSALAANLNRQMLHAEAGDGRGFFLDNEDFHQIIARAARLEGVWNTIQGVKMLWDRIGHIANRDSAHTREIIAEHEAIAVALAAGDPARASEAMRQHMRSVDHAIERLRPVHSSYFSD